MFRYIENFDKSFQYRYIQSHYNGLLYVDFFVYRHAPIFVLEGRFYSSANKEYFVATKIIIDSVPVSTILHK